MHCIKLHTHSLSLSVFVQETGLDDRQLLHYAEIYCTHTRNFHFLFSVCIDKMSVQFRGWLLQGTFNNWLFFILRSHPSKSLQNKCISYRKTLKFTRGSFPFLKALFYWWLSSQIYLSKSRTHFSSSHKNSTWVIPLTTEYGKSLTSCLKKIV